VVLAAGLFPPDCAGAFLPVTSAGRSSPGAIRKSRPAHFHITLMREAMAYKYRFGTKLRDQTWALEKLAAYKAERGELPICVHCDQPVMVDQAWDVAHVTIPRAFGGKSVGCGHRKCNQEDNNKVVTPAVAKADRVHRKFVGIDGPGLGRSPMRGGRRTRERITMGHGVQPRQSHAQKHRDFLRRRYFIEVEDIDGLIEVQP
jgi:hypothetical protein